MPTMFGVMSPPVGLSGILVLMASASNIARLLVQLAIRGPEEDPLTQFRLQKLMYYVQGWSLAKKGTAAFPDRIEAWAKGPVVPTLRPEFGDYKSEVILGHKPPDDGSCSPHERYFVLCVWEKYKQFSATKLYEKTHSEKPYKEARGGLPVGASSTAEISHEAMRDYFLNHSCDAIDFDPENEPDWQTTSSDEFLFVAQSIMAQHAGLMRRLA